MGCYHCGDAPCPVKSGFCHCGCGTPTPVATSHHYPSDTHWKYANGHAQRDRNNTSDLRRRKLEHSLDRYRQTGLCPYCGEKCPVGGGFCHCGCGSRTPPIEHTHLSQGRLEGMPSQFIHNHAREDTTQLSIEVVRQVRYRYATQEISMGELAKRFGCSRTMVRNILLFDTYPDAGIDTSYKEVG